MEHSFLITKFERIAQAHGMPLDVFLGAHTVLPYVTAFLSRQEGSRVRSMLVGGLHPRGHSAALILRTPLEGQRLRLCPACVEEETRRYGESYWHRAHQLSGVEVCEQHNVDLLVTAFVIGRTPNVPPPHEVHGVYRPFCVDTSDEVRWAIACVSALLLRSECTQEKLTRDYRKQGSQQGYVSESGVVRQSMLLHDLRLYFGTPFLVRYRCGFHESKAGQWPTKLLLESAHVAMPLKHVLLMAFLERRRISLPPMPSRQNNF